jgi:hypothetical protein
MVWHFVAMETLNRYRVEMGINHAGASAHDGERHDIVKGAAMLSLSIRVMSWFDRDEGQGLAKSALILSLIVIVAIVTLVSWARRTAISSTASARPSKAYQPGRLAARCEASHSSPT